MRKAYRQGDVLVRTSNTKPDNATPVERDEGRVILAYGEVTGHAHALVEKEVSLYEVVTDGDVEEMRQRFMSVDAEEAQLVHEEHSTAVLPKGGYEVRRQVQYTPDAYEIVAD